jgi:hypothetical protein
MEQHQLETAHGRWLEVMVNARRLLSKPYRWSHTTHSLNAKGLPCVITEATRYSLIGALEWGLDDPNELYALCAYMCRVLGMKGNLHDWHRHIEESGDTVVRADVLALLDKAIKATEKVMVTSNA